MVGPQGTKHQFIINVTEEGLQEALGSLIWEAMTESVWSSCFSQADSEGLCACMSACAIHQNNGGSLFLTQANLCLHHPGHLYHTHIWYILSLFTALECRQQVSFSSERAVCVIEEPRRVLCAVPPSRGCRGSSWKWWVWRRNYWRRGGTRTPARPGVRLGAMHVKTWQIQF